LSLHFRFAIRDGQEPAPSYRGSAANPSRWLHEGKRARHGTEHPRFGDIDHAQGLGCVDACPSSHPATTTAAPWKAGVWRRQHQTARLRFEGPAAWKEGCSSASRVAERKPQEAKHVSDSCRAHAVRDPAPGRSVPAQTSSKSHGPYYCARGCLASRRMFSSSLRVCSISRRTAPISRRKSSIERVICCVRSRRSPRVMDASLLSC